MSPLPQPATPRSARPPDRRSPAMLAHAGRWLAAQTAAWLSTEGQRWVFVTKAMLAAFGALWLAFRLGLDSPGTAMTTTVILALPSSGMVLEKAFYRFLGTLVGCASALLLIALFPQTPTALFLGLALWVGLCTSGAALYRNQQSYSFVLAGYTACMIVIPAVGLPSSAFALAVTRVTEVGLGILCAAVVHDVILPRQHGRQVLHSVQARYAGFIDFCAAVLEHRTAPADAELSHLKFAADIAALEASRAAAFFEASHAREHTRRLQAFNAAFMTVLTTFYTLHRLSHRLHQQRHDEHATPSPVPALIAPLHAMLAQCLRAELDAERAAAMRASLAQGIAAARRQLQAQLQSRLQASPAGGSAIAHPVQIDFDTAVELLERYARDLSDFAALYQGLAPGRGKRWLQAGRQQVDDPGAYTPKTPPAIVLASGFRAACALLVTVAAWYWTAWPYAGNAILMATIFCALASSSPRPTAMVKQVLTGFLIAMPLSFICEFLIVARADDFPLLVLAALPLFALGSYVSTGPKWGGVGVGISMFSATLLVPLNLMHYDVESFLSNELALVLGVAVAGLMFAALLPGHTMGQKDHVASALWREALRACTAPLYRLKRRFDNRVRDLLNQLNAASGPAPGEAARAVVRQGLTLLELGHAAIELRQLIAGSPAGPVQQALKTTVRQLALYLRAPSPASAAAARLAILQAGPAVRLAMAEADVAPQRRLRLQTALTDLHAMYTSLLDQMPPAGSDGSDNIDNLSSGANHHAA